MPELPEVEVTRRGVAPHLEGRMVTAVTMRHTGLRWPFPESLPDRVVGRRILSTGRRRKYLLLHFDHGTLIVHLGMSGHLSILPAGAPAGKHDHFELVVGDMMMRLTDPRRFGAVLWHEGPRGELNCHVLLAGLGIEPLGDGFDGTYLYVRTRNRSVPIKQLLLSGNIVVGVGNIYASESLFRAGIHPKTPARRIGLARYEKLASEIRLTLASAIEQGGSSLRDFFGADGQAGYFQQSYFVYDRAGAPCRICEEPVRQIRQGQRSTFYCSRCQK